MKLIHLTDLHIAVNRPEPALAGTADRTRQAIAEINALHGDAELCIITGDIVADPDPASYDLAQDIISELSMPTVGLLGNHDDRDMARRQLSCVAETSDGFLQQAIPTSRGLFLTLDTLAEGTHAGMLCDKRLEWVSQHLSAHPGPVWIFMHHAPFATGLAAMDSIGLDRDAANKLGDLLTKHGNVAHLFFGHYHRPMSGVWRGIPFSSHRSMMLQCALDLVTEHEVNAIYEEPQYAVVLADDERTVVHYHDFAANAVRVSMGSASG
ncbi:phosphodiesterase [Shimia sp. CNT1-13L.2]|uniref:phosphodiesterase n=1 Tax=Shimia sp. CNT1-13L.2 TaxID=2959663 RepID=UPI0020CCF9D1|nr:phosphodiesterase [Shimia sp. CNT1-13L.2]MCP9481791.1 phosphodiesterase [Shimia sp. CNT1-13L.2]